MDNNNPVQKLDFESLTPEQLTELQDRLAAEEAARIEAEKQAADSKSALAGTVEELKKLRSQRDPETTPPTKAPEASEISAVVEAAFAKREAEAAAQNREIAIKRFQAEHTEFSADNDPGSLKMSTLLAEFNSFNTSGARTVDDFMGFLSKAHRLVTPVTQAPADTVVDTTPTPTSKPTPKTVTPSKLTAKEREAAAQAGWTEEKFIDFKQKNPDLVRQMLD